MLFDNMVKVTKEEFNGWQSSKTIIYERLAQLQDQSYALSGIILSALNVFIPKKEVLPIGAEVSDKIEDVVGAWVLKNLKETLKDALINKAADSLDLGRTKAEIKEDIGSLFGTLDLAWAVDFDDCIELVNGVATVTGIQVTNVQINTWLLTLREARTQLQLCDDFNEADFKETLADGVTGLLPTIATRIEQYIFNGFKKFSDGEKLKVQLATQEIDRLIGLIEKPFPDCKDTPPKKEEKIKPPPTKKDDPDYIEILLPPAISITEEPPPEGDCCTELVASINKLQNLRDWFNEVIRWIRETRIELKEARQDLKKVLRAIHDTRVELKEARQDAKKILANQDLILDALFDLKIDVAVNSEEIIKTRDLVALNGELMTIGLGGIATLLGGISAALSATLAAIIAEIAEAQVAILAALGGLAAAIAGVETSLAAGFLKMQAEILKIMLQISKGFIRIEELLNPYVTGEITSYDWVEMTKEEKAEQAQKDKEAKEKAKQDNRNLIDQNLVDPGSAIVVASTAITVTKAIALTALKLNPKAIVYAGYGILGVIDLLQKTVSIVNDLQGDVKEPGALAFTTIKVPVIKWFPELYTLDNDGHRDYSKLTKPQDDKKKDLGNFYQAPDYSSSTPYIAIQEVDVPLGMEQYYIDEYNENIDKFFYSGDGGIILMPDGWENKPMKYRPQLELYFVEVREDGTFNRKNSYVMNVQHYNIKLGKPKHSPIPDYKKGSMCGVMELTDGSKNIVFGINKKTVILIMQAIKEITIPEFAANVNVTDADNNNIKWLERDTSTNGEPMKVVAVTCVWADYYSKGRPNRTYAIQRDWRVYFDRGNLF